jgi:hypothetical protein
MTTWTIRAHHLREHQATQLAHVLQDVDTTQIVYRTTAAGDERKLRGIPAIGRGVQGAIPGTSPHKIR